MRPTARAPLAGIGLALAAPALLAGAAWATGSRSAHPARLLRVREEGRLRFISDDATTIFDKGRVDGTIPGEASVTFTYNGSPTVKATFTIRGTDGTIRGRARCRLSNPAGPAPSFRGALSIGGGSGRYTHARGGGELFGVFHRRGYSLIFQAIGKLRY